jgi:hypothetical protein
MNLIACVFGLRALTRDDDRAAGGIHLNSVLIGGFDRQEEQRAQHFHHVIVGVLVIIQQDDVVKGCEAFAFESSGFRSRGGDCQPSNGRMNQKGGATDSTGLHPSWEVVPGSELP